MLAEALKSNNYEPCHSFASYINLSKKAIVESRDVSPNEQKGVDIFVNMTETVSENLIENESFKKENNGYSICNNAKS